MHEIKSPFLILMEEQSYLAQSLESAFEKQNVEVKIVTIAEASSIVISEKPSGYLICTSPELLKKAVSVKVMVDQAIKNKTPVFIMGNIDELELLWETLPQQMVMDVFTRPITVGDMVDNICTQMNDFYQLKKHTILAVDDSGIILRKIKALLEDTYQVVLANSGAMAIKSLTIPINKHNMIHLLISAIIRIVFSKIFRHRQLGNTVRQRIDLGYDPSTDNIHIFIDI